VMGDGKPSPMYQPSAVTISWSSWIFTFNDVKRNFFFFFDK
jgi:hypothetical protein